MKLILLFTVLMMMSGCEVCKEHPGACAVAWSVATTCVALSVPNHHSERVHDIKVTPTSCANGACK